MDTSLGDASEPSMAPSVLTWPGRAPPPHVLRARGQSLCLGSNVHLSRVPERALSPAPMLASSEMHLSHYRITGCLSGPR